MVIACAIIFWIWGAPRFGEKKSAVAALRVMTVMFVIAVLAAGALLQQLRANLAGKTVTDIGSVAAQTYFSGNPVGSKLFVQHSSLSASLARGPMFDSIDKLIPKGTWSAVLLTPLSVSGDYLRDRLPLRLGRTYLDLLLSVPPGFLADRLGYERPIDATRGPAHEMRYGIGGTHAVVVPFMNFRMPGVLVIFVIWGWLFAKLEQALCDPGARALVERISAYGITCAIIPHWIWYGEKMLVTGLFIWLILSAIYLLATTPSYEIARREASLRERGFRS
jgi:hypothetical protein